MNDENIGDAVADQLRGDSGEDPGGAVLAW